MEEQPIARTATPGSAAPAPIPLHPLLLVDEDLWSRLSSMVRQLCVGLVDQAARLHVMHEARADMGDLLGPALVAPVPRGMALRRKNLLMECLAAHPEMHVNVVHVLGGSLLWAGLAIHEEKGFPLAMHVTSESDVAAARRLRGCRNVELMAIAEPLRQQVLKKVRFSEDRVHLVRPGMRSSTKGRISTGDEGVLTVFVWARKKAVGSVEVVLNAAQKLLADGRQMLIFVLGSGPNEDQLRRSVKALGLRSRVTFVPELMADLLGKAGEDVLVLPQAPREMTLQTLGALAAGVVVVAAGHGLHDCIRDGETALIFEQDNANALASQLNRLIQDRPLARRLSDQGRVYIRDHHKVSVMVDRVVCVYRNLIAEARARPKPAGPAT